MKFKKLNIQDAFLIEPNKNYDLRGAFFRTFCEKELNSYGLDFKIKQCNLSYNKKKFTFRGLHYSTISHKENKILLVANGSIENYMIDLRKNSSTYLKKIRINLDSFKNNLIYVPTGCANGFLTLKKDTLIHYYMDNYYNKNKSVYKGIRYNDPLFKIKIKKTPSVISKKDQSLNNFVIENTKK
jgi:dTDP-4-dehydrorhamnose 3,5-epimerase|tara:strand:+ start:282 stop:833 length:552 start_codon:yes stop_codon:yes gene_type:complete